LICFKMFLNQNNINQKHFNKLLEIKVFDANDQSLLFELNQYFNLNIDKLFE